MGADKDARDIRNGRNTPLHFAAAFGHGLCIARLTAAGASLEAKDRRAFPPPPRLAPQLPAGLPPSTARAAARQRTNALC